MAEQVQVILGTDLPYVRDNCEEGWVKYSPKENCSNDLDNALKCIWNNLCKSGNYMNSQETANYKVMSIEANIPTLKWFTQAPLMIRWNWEKMVYEFPGLEERVIWKEERT